MENGLVDLVDEEKAKKFSWKFMGSIPKIFFSNRKRSYKDAVKAVINSGLAENLESAKDILEKMIGKYSSPLGFDMQFRLDRITDRTGRTMINMGLYIPLNVDHYL